MSDVHETPLPDQTPDRQIAQGLGSLSLEGTPTDYSEYGLPDIPGGVLTPEEANRWAKNNGYINGKRGTFHNENSFLYVKNCHEVARAEDLESTLAVVRYLTSQGILHPATKWGVFKKPGNQPGYQLFAVSPKLKAWSVDDAIEYPKHNERLGKPLTDPNSAISEWCRRIAPDYTPDKDMNMQAIFGKIEEEPLLNLLNSHEAYYPDNWGWDSKGTLYPVDVEVINLRGSSGSAIMHRWYDSHPANHPS